MNQFIKQWNSKKKSNLIQIIIIIIIILYLFNSIYFSYRLNFEKLKNLKSQIEHAQHMVEKTGVRLQKDFDIWWTEQCELIEQQKNKYNDFNQQQQQQQKMITTSTSRGGGGGGGSNNNNNKMTIDSASSVASSIQSVNSSVFQSRPNSSLNSTATSQAYFNSVSKIFRYMIFY